MFNSDVSKIAEFITACHLYVLYDYKLARILCMTLWARIPHCA